MANDMLKLIGVIAGATTLFAFKKKRDYTEVIEKMTIDLHSVSNLRYKGGILFMNVSISFHNNTNIDFDIYTVGMISLRKIRLFYKGNLIGEAESNLTEFSLPAKSNVVVQNIETKLLLLNIIDQFLNNGIDGNLENYQLQIEVEALGKTYTIDQELAY
ncbi:hypothetical protein [Flavobacterium capsici]|uniref:Uncharacterized protein n=1 Tax=Flavobacterium capsici TaxID=3075618 RepID=A0AA96EYV8_9FLAO|nr:MULTISPECIES: hypothetical protein [unclassified Flavobacterium]WNM19288.1 hypothetical protein RN608_01065 [Flavobacterium sp. PMR2A8]WNM20677.1 hypothetical protein RN605_08235 [Flavobacterium sp. PMTSA4]